MGSVNELWSDLQRRSSRSGERRHNGGYFSLLHKPIWLFELALVEGAVCIMFLADPLWISALATLVTSLGTLVWAFRRKR